MKLMILNGRYEDGTGTRGDQKVMTVTAAETLNIDGFERGGQFTTQEHVQTCLNLFPSLTKYYTP
jgi:hypothetical protein